MGFKSKCEEVSTTLTTVYSLETTPIPWTALQPRVLRVIYAVHKGAAPICGGRGLAVCWLWAARPRPFPGKPSPSLGVTSPFSSTNLTSPRRPWTRKLTLDRDQRYETSPTVLKTCHCFLGGDDQNRVWFFFVFCSGQGFLTASSRANRSARAP